MVIMGRPDRARRRLPTRGLALLAAAVVAATVAVPSAQALSSASDPGREKQRVDKKVDALKSDVEDASAALRFAYTRLQQTQNRLPHARDVLSGALAAADAAAAANTLAAQELEVAKANEAKAQKDLAAATKAVASGRKRLAQFAAQIYQEQGFGQLDVALSSSDPQQFADRLAMVDTVMDVQGATVDRLATEQASLTALEDHVSALRADSDRKKAAAAAAVAKAQQAQAAAQQAKVQLDQAVAAQTTQAKAFADQLAADKKQLSAMQAEQNRLQKVLEARAAEARRRAAAAAKNNKPRGGGGGGGGGTTNDGGYLSRPVRTGWISSEFGMRFHPIYHVWRLHSGMDFAVPCGTPVYAAAPGTIIQAGYSYSYGNRIVIDHGLVNGVGLASTYNHLTRIVASGSVSRGELIAYSGTTGDSTGCHLHFEVMENGSFVNPRKWL